MGQRQEPQCILDEKEFLHSIANPLTTALALASKAQNLRDSDEVRVTVERLTKALEQIVALVKTRREEIKRFEH